MKAGGRVPSRGGVVDAVDCEEALARASALPLERALDAAERPGVWLWSLRGVAAELDPVLKGFGCGQVMARRDQMAVRDATIRLVSSTVPRYHEKIQSRNASS